MSLEHQHLTALNSLFQEIIPANRFYAAKLNTAKFSLPLKRLADFHRDCPFTTKDELLADQEEHPPFGSMLTYPRERYTRFHQTSGTSGRPLCWLDTPESWSWMLNNWGQVYRAAGVHGGEAVLFAFSFGPFLGFWTAFEAAEDLGCLCLPTGGLNTTARLRLIEEHGVGVVCCTPTYGLRMGEEAEKQDVNLSGVRRLIVAGEPGGSIPETRDRLESLWRGAQIIDHHGMTEVGPVSYVSPGQPNILRVIESAYLAEVIDPANEAPVTPGTPGELVLTTLGRWGSPLIRYRTGDLVKTCRNPPEGMAPYFLEGGILGRIDDMITIRGVNVYPGAVETVIRRFSDIAEYQVRISTQKQMAELQLTIEPLPSCRQPQSLVNAIQEELKSLLALRVPVDLASPGSLPRFEMKAKRWRLG